MNKTINELATKQPTGSMYIPVADSTSTGKTTISDVVAAAGAGPLIVTETGGSTLDKTWAEIRAAVISGRTVTMLQIVDEAETLDESNDINIGTLTAVSFFDDWYSVCFYIGNDSYDYSAQSEDGVLTGGGK